MRTTNRLLLAICLLGIVPQYAGALDLCPIYSTGYWYGSYYYQCKKKIGCTDYLGQGSDTHSHTLGCNQTCDTISVTDKNDVKESKTGADADYPTEHFAEEIPANLGIPRRSDAKSEAFEVDQDPFGNGSETYRKAQVLADIEIDLNNDDRNVRAVVLFLQPDRVQEPAGQEPPGQTPPIVKMIHIVGYELRALAAGENLDNPVDGRGITESGRNLTITIRVADLRAKMGVNEARILDAVIGGATELTVHAFAAAR